MGLPTVRLNAGILTGLVVGKSGVTLMARILGNAGVPITPATINAIAWQVSDLTQGTVVGSGTFVVAAAVFNALVQGDTRWTRDSALSPGPDGLNGYNFLGVIPAATFAVATLVPASELLPPDQLQADVAFTPVSGEPFRVVYRWKAVPAFA
jgi:hypothetical protein